MSAPSDAELTSIASLLGARLRAAGQRLATAESCTGGWVAKACTDLPGSSAWFECGFVTYSNAAKARDLGVPIDTLRSHGAVSEATVAAMARGARARAQVDLAVAISGIAGPDGGTADKPVGTVWFAAARNVNARIDVKTELRRLDGDRDDVRRAATLRALELALEFIQ